ncbi:Fruiting body protein SC1 [Psilocybe cubensis]|uniref:Fruiting body protein SC1 n=2 Tax=Psilocybe cubensis TaxID=181762 RepID=A0ACB8GUJ1_PSICU|nr:Fruiting body protein SC1 [Psilocybe cubensis]KAH9479145.1 Fruiting body protein SC1 [Psilocybe cubensis]
MFARAASTFVLALPLLAAASAVPRNDGPSNQCNTGSLQCCDSTQSATSSSVAGLLGLLGVVVGSVTGLVGVNCSPISVVGISGNSCSAQPVCCTDNSFNGVIALGCSPINLNL